MAGRKPKIPHSPFNGITLEQWQTSDQYVTWAKSDPMFAKAIAVVQNGMLAVPPEDFNGYRAAFKHLLALRVGVVRMPKAPEPNYGEPIAEMHLERDQAED